MTTNTATCRKGHERNAENSRQRTVTSGGKTRVINECLACARVAAAAKKATEVAPEAEAS